MQEYDPMATDRPRFFDDIAGVAGGAFSAFSGLYDEAEAAVRARMDEAIRKLDLVKREDFEAVQEMAANARAGQEAAEARLAALEIRVAALEGGAAPDDDLPDEDPAAPLIDEL
jgi:BMFP domain-containing protein YqiC